jgi:hypothetical protein
VTSRREPNFGYRLLRAIYPAFRLIFPHQVIRADDLARAMVDVAVGEQRNVRGAFWRTAAPKPSSSSASSKNTRLAVLVGDKIEPVTSLEQLAAGALPVIGAADAS